MNMILCVVILVTGLTQSQGISLPYASPPRKYHGSSLVWDGYCDDKERFIAMFQVPQSAIFIKGTSDRIWDKHMLTTGNLSS